MIPSLNLSATPRPSRLPVLARILAAGTISAALPLFPGAASSIAQETLKGGLKANGTEVLAKDDSRIELPSSTQSDPDARIIEVGIPAPRGVIVDRYGRPLAQTKVVNYVAVKFPKFEKPDPLQIISYARERIEAVERMLAKDYGVTDERILKHYENRRWLPLILSAFTLSPNQSSAVEGMKQSGIILVPTYQRTYP
jgi:penicillin-binding protein 2